MKESFPKLQASIHNDALIFLQFCCCNVKYLSAQIGALYVRLRFCDFFPFPAFPFSFEPFPSTELRCPQYHSVTEWGSRVWTTDQFSNPSLFPFSWKVFQFCLTFILWQEVGRVEGKQTTLTLVCRANLAVRETLTVFNLACSAAATKYLLSKEEENRIHDSCSRHAFAHAHCMQHVRGEKCNF